MKYYFDVIEKYIKTIAVDADNLYQAKKRAEKAYDRKEFEISNIAFDEVEFVHAQEKVEECIKEGFFAEEELVTFNCNDAIYDIDRGYYSCPVCGKYVCDDVNHMVRLGEYLPKTCDECGATLHYKELDKNTTEEV